MQNNAQWRDLWRVFTGRFSQDVLWNVASLGILAVGGVLINILILNQRGEATLGVFNQVYAIYIIFSQIGVGGVQFSVLKEVSYHQDDKAHCSDLTTSGLLLAAGFAVVGCGGLVLVAPLIGRVLQSADVTQGIYAVVLGLFFFSLNKVLINTVNGLAQMRVYAVLQSLRFFLLVASLIGLVLTGVDSALLTWCFSISEVLLFGAVAGYLYSRVLFLRVPHDLRYLLGKHLSFGLRGMFSGILLQLNTRVDVLMLGYFLPDARVGIYSFAAMLAEGISQIPLAVRSNLDPVLGRDFADGDIEAINGLARQVRRYFYPLMLGLCLTIMILYPVAIRLFTEADVVTESWLVFLIIMVGVMLNARFRPFRGIVLQGGRPGLHTLSVVALVANDALLNLVAIPRGEIYGAALVTALTFVLEGVLLTILARRLFGVRL